jgi:hypothetical protein
MLLLLKDLLLRRAAVFPIAAIKSLEQLPSAYFKASWTCNN